MINNINSVQTGQVPLVSAKSNATGSVMDNRANLNQKSSIVELQTKVGDVNSKAESKVTAENAKSFVSDITSMLLKTDGAFQANLNGFDAARLLS